MADEDWNSYGSAIFYYGNWNYYGTVGAEYAGFLGLDLRRQIRSSSW